VARVKTEPDLSWDTLTSLRRWTPLRQVTKTTPVKLGDDLFKIDTGKYLVCVPYKRDLTEGGGERFITSVLWARTDGAARRAALLQIEADQVIEGGPPPDLLLPGRPVSYGDIIRELKKDQTGEFGETASYRVATDGAFVHRSIVTESTSFHFRNPEHDDSEPCYAIEFRLPEI
jgi:hypothetical protein